ncbi:MAG TPA: APC family permease [Steroidobacteraceae bacterium]
MSLSAEVLLADARGGRLLRMLGVGFGIAVGVGATIGAGILRTPGEVAGYMGTAGLTLAVWLVGGLYTLLCASSVTELATMLPRAGGWYVYAARAFGRRIGFVAGCCDWMNQTVGLAFVSVALGEFIAELHPGLASHETVIAIAALSALTLLNLTGLKVGSRTQNVTSLVKALALVTLVIGCFMIPPGAASTHSAVNLQTHSTGLLISSVLALQAVVVTYDAWYTPMYFAEENKSPATDLPRSMLGTVLSCIAIFLLINAALIHALGMEQLQAAKAPAAQAALAAFGRYGKQIIQAISIVTLISCDNATLLTAPRVLYGMARDGLLPSALADTNQGGTPAWALLLCLAVSSVLILSGTLETLIAIDSVLVVAVYVFGFSSLLRLRQREPRLPRPYKTWWYPWSTLCVLTVSLGFLFGTVVGDLKHSLFTIFLLLLSYLAARRIVPPTRAESST